ncbi:hypothetical protein L6164_004834 [Bauhinia variegata]|uniref:Uncharacterized protein n=1 Tax=Bauhinia variegata TaxID=167791 RepID=A0ACB9PRL1_BAUVA|nr:hypothetical protein L6164_004834 [Bauhinia variegata]
MFRSLSSSNIELSPTSKYDQNDYQNGFSHHVSYESQENEGLYSDVQFQGGSESVSSTDDLPADPDMQMSPEVVPENRKNTQVVCMERAHHKTKFEVICGGFSFALLAMVAPLIWINSQQDGHYLVPT